VLLISAMWVERAHGAGGRVHNAALPMRAVQIGRSATVAVTFGQQGQRHANEGKWKWYQILHAVQVIFVARYLRDRALQREIK
jgi:hypothetical protein